MTGRLFVWLFFPEMLFCVGCQTAQEHDAYADIQGIKLSDLQAKQAEQIEPVLSFSILTYTLDPNSVEAIQDIADLLSNKEIRYDSPAGFRANGFWVGTGRHEEGAAAAQKLQSLGAARVAQGNLSFPSGSDEILFGVDNPVPRLIAYSAKGMTFEDMAVQAGKIGWVISPKKDPAGKELVRVTLAPVFWRMGVSDLRLREGKDPYEFHFFDAGRVYFPLEAGQFFLLAPGQIVRDRDTLGRILFETPQGDKVRLFVVICGTVRD